MSSNIVGEIFNDSWILLKKIGKGTFSEIWLAQNIHLTNSFVAMKIQKAFNDDVNSSASSVLKWEADVLKSLKNLETVPKFYHYESSKGLSL